MTDNYRDTKGKSFSVYFGCVSFLAMLWFCSVKKMISDCLNIVDIDHPVWSPFFVRIVVVVNSLRLEENERGQDPNAGD